MRLPSHEYARTWHRHPEPLLKGLDASVHASIGWTRRRPSILANLRREAEQIDALAPSICELTDHQLADRLLEYRTVFRRGGRAAEQAVGPALAAIREMSDRKIGLRPFLVQLMGALALHRGYLAEMATGEGKTLTASLAAILAGWTYRPCHVITANDYLVQRDAEWLAPLYHACGIRVGFVVGDMLPDKRRLNYERDVTYTTNKEVVADFLRDSLQVGTLRDPTRRLVRQLLSGPLGRRDALVLRGLHTAIVDEADSVLIDEAVTPLIISTPRKNEALRTVVGMAEQIASGLKPDEHYRINTRYHEIEFTRPGEDFIEDRCSELPGIWRGNSRRTELIKQALVAREFYHLDKQYVVEDQKIMIVDEFTGRRMPNRSWRQGMHQAVEAKEHIPITDPTEVVARLSFQRFFRFYYHLSGMTGTAKEASGEFWAIYKLPVITIPPNRPCIRQELPDRLFATAEDKWTAVVEEIARLHATGRPILVGTRSVAASEKLAARLRDRGFSPTVLNAIRHQDEAVVVAMAGTHERITIATNMAGRGTDIRLEPAVVKLGGLHVLATERHGARRIDRQLFGRCARQGEPGSSQAFVSAEDELFMRFLPGVVQKRVRQAMQMGWPGAEKLAGAALGLAQRRSQRAAFKQRANVLRLDDWMEEALSFAAGEF